MQRTEQSGLSEGLKCCHLGVPLAHSAALLCVRLQAVQQGGFSNNQASMMI